MDLQKLIKYEINHETIQRLFAQVNNGRRWHVDEKSFEFVQEIIFLWFEEQGLDFWTRPEIESYEFGGDPPHIIFYCLPKDETT